MSAIAIGGLVVTAAAAGYSAYSQNKAQKEQAAMQREAMDNQRSYGGELGGNLSAQVGNAQERYLAEKQYGDLYARNAGWQTQRLANQFTDNYGQNVSDLTQGNIQAQNIQRRGDIKALNKYGQNYTSAYVGATPQIKGLIDELTGQAQNDLQLGQSMSPEEERMAMQRARAGYAARGTGLTDQSALAEVLQGDEYGRQRQNERRAFAGGVLNQAQGVYAPAMSAFMREASGTSMYPQMMGLAAQTRMSSNPSLFNPESAYAGNINNQNYQTGLMQQQAEINAKQQQAATQAKFWSDMGTTASGALSAYAASKQPAASYTSPSTAGYGGPTSF